MTKFELLTIVIGFFGLMGSVVSLFISRRALIKADAAIRIEKSSHSYLFLRSIIDEIDQWSMEYEDKRNELLGKNYNPYQDDLPNSFNDWYWDLHLMITKFYYRLDETYPVITGGVLTDRARRYETELGAHDVHKFLSQEEARVGQPGGYNSWEEADYVLLKESAWISREFRGRLVKRMSEDIALLL